MRKLKILFLCTGNSCRSQMAEGWTKNLKHAQLDVWSAGIEAHGLNPYAVRVMAEAGVYISEQKSEIVEQLLDIPFDYVITVCDHARDNCPVFPLPIKSIHKSFDDPPFLAQSAKSEEEVLEIYRRVRDEIRDFVMTLPESLQNS